MASYAEQAAVGAATVFIDRVKMAMLTHAQYRANTGDDAQRLATLGKAIINNPATYAPLFAQLVATTSFAQAGIEQSPMTGASVDDASITSAVEVVFPSFAR